jgi:hypothetical protein
MIKIYVENQELDLFADEGITLNRSVKELKDISSVFATFSQQFTVPASKRNNKIFQHYYRDDLQTTVSSLKRLNAHITLSGQVFETGGIQIEGASIVNGKPRDYKLGFYGNVSRMKEYVGEETLKNLDLSAYNHSYDAGTILPAFGSSNTSATLGLFGGAILYPLFSPVRNWIYNSDGGGSGNGQHDPNNIAYHGDHGSNVHGVHYYEPKPALQITKILDAIESKYGVTFSGSFLSSSPFNQLYMWLHNREGYTFEGVDNVVEQGVVVEPFKNVTHSTVPIPTSISPFPFGTDEMKFKMVRNSFSGTRRFRFDITFTSLTEDCFVYFYENGALKSTVKYTPVDVGPKTFFTSYQSSWLNTTFEFKIGRTTPNVAESIEYNLEVLDFYSNSFTPPRTGTGFQSSTTYSEDVVISNLIPDMKITEFLNALIKQFNLIVTSTDGETFNLETYDTYYGSGNEVDLSRWIDTREIEVGEIPRYGALEFRYNESNQVLQKQFRSANGRGYGDLVNRFNFDSQETFSVNVPFDLPFTQKLDDEGNTGNYTDFTVYKSIELNESGEGSSYYGAPVVFYYGENLDISSSPISWVDESNDETQINLIPLCETVTSSTVLSSEGLTFSQETNPLLQTQADRNLYTEYWDSFISNTYNQQAKIFSLSAYINLGTYIKLNLNDIILWKGRKYIINSMSTDFKTGKTDLQLVTKL